ncbi:hypothetical protein ACFVZM_06660 [Streptomyces sioyaensis]|uniref:hypothetical protein n=1 Tax=Streptomyces sioyaensis TaxID=67364 RepID=UPI0036C4F0A6
MTMEELVHAGAPELPAGWFYRVTSNGFCFEVQVREWRRRFGSRQHGYALVRSDEVDGLTAIVAACRHAVRRMEEEDEHWRKRRDVAKYLGDYDPREKR